MEEDCESGEGNGEDGDKLCCICHDPVEGQSADDVSDVLECHKVGPWPISVSVHLRAFAWSQKTDASASVSCLDQDERMHQKCLAMWMQRQPQPSCPLCRCETAEAT